MVGGYKLVYCKYSSVETLMTPEHFAQILVDDIYDCGNASVSSLIQQIAQAIRKQVGPFFCMLLHTFNLVV